MGTDCSEKILKQLRKLTPAYIILAFSRPHIFTYLELAADPNEVGRMNYENFGDIVKRHRVTRQNWPIPTFCTPSKLPVLELHALHGVLNADNPPSLFRKLTEAEWALVQAEIAKGGSYNDLPPSIIPPLPPRLLLMGPGPSHSDGTSDDPDTPPSTTPAPQDPQAPPLPPSPPPTIDPSDPAPDSPPTPQPPLTANGGVVISLNKAGPVVIRPPRKVRYDAGLTPAQKKIRKKEIEAEKAAEKRAKDEAKKAAALAKKQAKAAESAAKKASKVAKKPWLQEDTMNA